MTWAEKIRNLTLDGIYVNNLRSIAAEASKGLQDAGLALPAFVLLEIAQEVLSSWEERPLPFDEQQLVENALRSPIIALLDIIRRNGSHVDIFDSLEALIMAWLSVQSSLKG